MQMYAYSVNASFLGTLTASLKMWLNN